tara:strand:- start:190 stop:693 length:504 start_codon:yes stop_codon:yes gene_type:complete
MCDVFLGESLDEWLSKQPKLSEVDRHRDHIIPCSKLDLTDDRQLQMCFLGINYRLIPAKENLIKGSLLVPGLMENYMSRAKKYYFPHLLTRNEEYALELRKLDHECEFQCHFHDEIENCDVTDPDFWEHLLKHQFRDDLFCTKHAIMFLRKIFESHFMSKKRKMIMV